MFNTKSPIVKIVGYIIIGFFGIIIVISFGMPDFMSKLGVDTTNAAVINGEKIHMFEYLRYRDRFRSNFGKNLPDNKSIDNLIFNRFAGEIILLQKAKKIGISISDEMIMKQLKELDDFKNPNTKKYDPERFKYVVRQNNMTYDDFFKLIRQRSIKKNLFRYITMGVAVTNDEIKTRHILDNSKIQIKYAYVSDKDIKNRFKDKLTVTDAEVSDEMKNNLKEIKDPKTDKKRIKAKLEKIKFKTIKKEIISKIDKLSIDDGNFTTAATILQGKISISNIFKIGDTVKEAGKNGKSLPAINNSRIFRENCLIIPKGAASKVIESASGLYIFTPILIDIKKGEPSPTDSKIIAKTIENIKTDTITNNLMTQLSEKSKIVKYLKNN